MQQRIAHTSYTKSCDGGEMKIVLKDGLDRENRSDGLIAEHVAEPWAKEIVRLLQADAKAHHDDESWFTAEPDDYVLYVFTP